MKNAVKKTAGELLTNYHSHTDIEEHHTVCENTYDEASADQECPSDGGHPDSKLAAGHRGKRCYRRGKAKDMASRISHSVLIRIQANVKPCRVNVENMGT